MAPPATRTSFKRSASEEADDTSVTSSKRAKASSRSTQAQTPSQGSEQDKSSCGERPKRFTPDGREIPYLKPRPNGSWRMITGEDIAYTPEERPTRAPASAYKQTSITQSFGQSTYSGKERKARPQHKIPTSSSSKTKPTMAASSKRPNEATSTAATSNPPPPTKAGPSKTYTSNHITLTHSISNIFSAPPRTLLLHACNTEGSWGAGIALAFKKTYPTAFETYRDHCNLTPSDELIGTALLIPPSNEDDSNASKHFIGCLFTSVSKGRRKDSPDKILRATGTAMKDLVTKVSEWNAGHKEAEKKIGGVRMCKINSGLFGVKWERTQAVLEGIEVDGDGHGTLREIEVISRNEED